MSSRSEQPADPYVELPSFWSRHGTAALPVVVGAATVVLTVLSFPPFKTPEFAYAMLLPGIFWAYMKPRLKTYVLTMAAAQAVAWTILLGWLHNVTWLGLLLLGPFTGIWVGLWYLGAWWVMPRMLGRPTPVRLMSMLGLAGAWVLLEWSRTWFLGGFPWLPLAASQWERPSILQIAGYTGSAGISFVLVAMNIGFAAYAHRLFFEGRSGLGRRSQEFLLGLFLLLVCISIQIQETTNRQYFKDQVGRVALVQPDIPQAVKWDPAAASGILDILEKTTLQAAGYHPNLILWSEAVTPMALKGDARVRAWTENLVSRAGVPLLLGSISTELRADGGESWRNAAFLVDPKTGLQEDYYSKRHLVPFGEYVPLRPIFGWLSKFVEIGGDFEEGDDPSSLSVDMPGGSIGAGVLICFEDTYPRLAMSSVRAGADMLVVISNNGWFGEGGAAYQHAAHSVLRAVETRRPVLRCGNAGWSGWIDEFGNIRKVLTNGDGSIYFRGAGSVDVVRDSRWVGRESFYVAHGDWFVAASAVLAAFSFALLRGAKAAETRIAEQEIPGPL